MTSHAEVDIHSSWSGQWYAKVTDPPLGINHTRLDEGASTDCERGKDQVDIGGRSEIKELEDSYSSSSL